MGRTDEEIEAARAALDGNRDVFDAAAEQKGIGDDFYIVVHGGLVTKKTKGVSYDCVVAFPSRGCRSSFAECTARGELYSFAFNRS